MSSAYQRKIEHELARIEQAMINFPEGATVQEIRRASGLKIELYTLQRRLKTLVDKGILTLSGTRRTARYYQVKQSSASPSLNRNKATIGRSNVPLSDESKTIIDYLSRPFDQRDVVGYNPGFLEKYRPNIDYYLSDQEREQLKQLTAAPDSGDLPAGTYARHILQRLLIDLSWNSSRLEGNTYSLLDTERLINKGEPAPDKTTAEAQMILNHKDAIEFLVSGAAEIGFNRYTLLNLHAMLANNLLPDPAAPGRLRTYGVGIKKSAYTPTSVPQLIEEMFDRILLKAAAITDPHEQALFIMVQLPYLQPFEDVNKRVSRLAANIPLNQHNLIPISFIGVPEDLYIQGLLGVDELNRTELLKDIFLWACARSADRYAMVRQTIGAPDPFRIKYRQPLQSLITEIIAQGMNPAKASVIIKERSLMLPEPDRASFIEMVETELLSLHEGNFARYRITPREFQHWKEAWSK